MVRANIRDAPIAKMVLSKDVMVFSGKISYSIYLLHLPVFDYLQRFTALLQWPVLFAIVGIAVTILLATASYRLIESPAQNAIRAFGAKFTHIHRKPQ